MGGAGGAGAAWTFRSGGCELCPEGNYQRALGATSPNCSRCPEGTYQTGTGEGQFALCEAGVPSPGRRRGWGLVHAMPAGTFLTGTGAAFIDNCTACTAGKYQSRMGASLEANCTPCAAGSYQTGFGMPYAYSCTLCDSGSYQNQTGATASELCFKCPAGTYQTGSGLVMCVQCHGEALFGTGAMSESKCIHCQPGYLAQVNTRLALECLRVAAAFLAPLADIRV